jgi:tRNA-dihydrouridine synthase B
VRMVQGYEVDPDGAAIEFRKHLGWYVKGLYNSADLRRKLHQVRSFDEVQGIFEQYLADGANFRDEVVVPREEEDVSRLTCEAAA